MVSKPESSGKTSGKSTALTAAPTYTSRQSSPLITFQILQEKSKRNDLYSNFASEYKDKYPNEQAHFKRLLLEWKNNLDLNLFEMGFNAFHDEDFDGVSSISRWPTTDRNAVKRFLQETNRKYGDIFESDPVPYLIDGNNKINAQQIMRNTPCFPWVIQSGEVCIAFGFVDLSNFLWAIYPSHIEEKVRFYCYDQAEVSVARSVLIYELMKRPKTEVSDKTILQIWFSSCWDQDTQREFYSFLDKHVPNINNTLLAKFASIWKTKIGMTAQDAKSAFNEKIRGFHFVPLLNLKVKDDRVAFARYLFTGCLFLDEGTQPVSGNVTMFPSRNESWLKRSFESFFATIHVLPFEEAVSTEESLINLITKTTRAKMISLRKDISESKIECHLFVKNVKPGDDSFALEVKKLKPDRVDWSNIPDYWPKLQFLNFARKCSEEDTVHQAQSMNSIKSVFGAHYLDYADNREFLEQRYRVYRENMVEPEMKLAKMIRWPLLGLPSNNFTQLAVIWFSESYLKYFLKTSKNKIIKYDLNNDHHIMQAFMTSFSLIFFQFTFNDEVPLVTTN